MNGMNEDTVQAISYALATSLLILGGVVIAFIVWSWEVARKTVSSIDVMYLLAAVLFLSGFTGAGYGIGQMVCCNTTPPKLFENAELNPLYNNQIHDMVINSTNPESTKEILSYVKDRDEKLQSLRLIYKTEEEKQITTQRDKNWQLGITLLFASVATTVLSIIIAVSRIEKR